MLLHVLDMQICLLILKKVLSNISYFHKQNVLLSKYYINKIDFMQNFGAQVL